MKKILFFLPNLAGGGAERVAVNIIRQLDKDYFDISLVLVNQSGKYLNLIPEYVKVYNLESQKTILSIFRLYKQLKQIEPDIVFSTLIRTHIALNIALQGIKERPVVFLRSPNSPKLLLSNKQLGIVMRYFLERAYRKADVILAQTPEMKSEISSFHKIKKDKIVVFLNPIDTDLIDEKIKQIINPFDMDKINVVAAGRLLKQKGFDILIKSFAKVIRKNSNFHLSIIGEDVIGEKVKLQNLVLSLGIEKNVQFLGFQSNPYQYFYYSDLYVLSSRWEGLPNTVLENLYLKKPIVATKCIPFMSELIENGNNGFLVEVEDIEQLAISILEYKQLKKSKDNFVRLDVNNFFCQLIDSYHARS